MHQSRLRAWLRPRRFLRLLGTAISGLALLVPATLSAGTGVRASAGVTAATATVYLGNAAEQEAPVITSAPTATFLSGVPEAFPVTATGYPAPTFSETGALPAGVTFSANGSLAGTAPTGAAGAYSITITASNSYGTATQAFTLIVPLLPAAAVAVEGTNGAMYVQAPQLSSGWHSEGGQIVGPPAVAAPPNPNGYRLVSPFFVATGTNHYLYIRSLALGWRQVGPDRGSCLGSPAAVVTGTAPSYTVTLACDGLNHSLWENSAPWSGSGLPQFTSGWRNLGGVLTAGPAVAPVGGTLTFFATGTHGRIYTRTLSAGYTGQSWACIGNPSAAVQPTFGITTFACQGTDHGLWEATSSGAAWSGAVRVEVGFALTGSPAFAGTSRQWELFYEATGPGVWETGWNGGPLGGVAVGGVGAVALD